MTDPSPHRGADPLVKDRAHPCFGCAKCCRYVAVGITAPRGPKRYEEVLWFLYHRGVSVYVDWDGDWYLQFATVCEHLTPMGLCGIHSERPSICRDFDWRECEHHVRDEAPVRWLWNDAPSFLAWLERQRPRAYARLQAHRRARAAEPREPELSRVRPERARAAAAPRVRRERPAPAAASSAAS
jgi:Fe-S-cluster containining protein